MAEKKSKAKEIKHSSSQKMMEISEKLSEKRFQGLKPRDPKRIDEILTVIRQLWDIGPDMRLGQLLLVCGFPEAPKDDSTGFLWDQEDDLTLSNLKKKLAEKQTENRNKRSVNKVKK